MYHMTEEHKHFQLDYNTAITINLQMLIFCFNTRYVFQNKKNINTLPINI